MTRNFRTDPQNELGFLVYFIKQKVKETPRKREPRVIPLLNVNLNAPAQLTLRDVSNVSSN